MITFLAVATLAGEINKESAKAEQYTDAMGQHLMKITTLTNDTTDENLKKKLNFNIQIMRLINPT